MPGEPDDHGSVINLMTLKYSSPTFQEQDSGYRFGPMVSPTSRRHGSGPFHFA